MCFIVVVHVVQCLFTLTPLFPFLFFNSFQLDLYLWTSLLLLYSYNILSGWLLSLMDMETFGTCSFHVQQNSKLFCYCHEPPFAYFYCYVEPNDCFSVVCYFIWLCYRFYRLYGDVVAVQTAVVVILPSDGWTGMVSLYIFKVLAVM